VGNGEQRLVSESRYAMAAVVEQLGRIDLTDDGVAKLIALAARLDALPEAAVTVETDFAYNGAFAVLEALRLRAAARGTTLSVRMPQGEYTRPFTAVVGFGCPGSGGATTIPIRRFTADDSAAIGGFLLDEWVRRARRLSSVECQYVVGPVAEIFANGLTHARSAVGVLACGQFFPAKEHLHLSVVDLGITIPGSLAAARGRREESIDASRAVAWAFEPGHSTLQTSRGLGLAILRTFIRESGATLRVYSGRASVRIHGDSWEAHAARRFPGTLIDLELPTAEVRLPDGRERYD